MGAHQVHAMKAMKFSTHLCTYDFKTELTRIGLDCGNIVETLKKLNMKKWVELKIKKIREILKTKIVVKTWSSSVSSIFFSGFFCLQLQPLRTSVSKKPAGRELRQLFGGKLMSQRCGSFFC